MPRIVPIRDLRKTSELSELAHTEQEPIFITKNGYSNLVVMSAELYDRYVSILRTDQDIFEAEEEVKKDGLRSYGCCSSLMQKLSKKMGDTNHETICRRCIHR